MKNPLGFYNSQIAAPVKRLEKLRLVLGFTIAVLRRVRRNMNNVYNS